MDANQQGIVDDLRKIPGCTVLILSAVGSGCPDILVGWKGANLLFEIKNPEVSYNQKLPTIERQKKFRAEWKGQVMRVESFTEIIEYMTGRDNVAGVWRKLNAASMA